MQMIRIFNIFLISLMPIRSLRKLLYNLLLNYNIDENSEIGWLTFINCNKFVCKGTKIKNFNFISSKIFETNNSEIGFVNKFKDINIVTINDSKISNNNKFIGEKKVSEENNFSLNKNSFIESNNYFDLTDSIEIMEDCSIYSHVQIWTHGFTEKRIMKNKNVLIKSRCIINNACLISMGVEIDENSTIEIGSIVTKSVSNGGFYFHELQKN